MNARRTDEIADAIRQEWGPVEVDPVPVARYLVGGLLGGVAGAFFVPVSAGFVADAVRGDIVGGLASAMSMVAVAVFVSFVAVPVGAVVGIAAGAAGSWGAACSVARRRGSGCSVRARRQRSSRRELSQGWPPRPSIT